MTKYLSLLVFFLLYHFTATSQPVNSASRVNIQIDVAQSVIQPGGETSAVVIMKIDEGWHINANKPTLNWLIGTELLLTPHEGLSITDIRYPAPKSYQFSFAGEALLVYEGDAPVFLNIAAVENITPGNYFLTGHLRVQACDDMTCLAPSNIPVSIPISVSLEAVESEASELFRSYEPGREGYVTFDQAGEQNQIASLIEESGLMWTLIVIFFIGLALNLTPCVYPMLTVTVSIFGAQNDSNTLRVFGKAVVYVLGIATMYSVLGVLAAMSGGLFGGLLQSIWVLAGIGLLLFALALSMFGLYEIQVPYWLTSKIGGTQASGIIGIYISGLVVGIFAAPCIGPPIIALLAFVGAKGDPVFGFWSFFILSLGLGFPYLILGTFSGLLQKLPKSGMWMIWIKQVFGVVLVAVALFYLGLAFFPKYVTWVLPVSMLSGGIYLGFILITKSDSSTFKGIKITLGIASVLFSVLLFRNLMQPTVEWTPYSEELLNAATANEQVVVLDFYADWCIPCLELDRVTFTDQRVISALDDMIRLKVDLTNFDSPESEALRQQYGVAGVPTIVFLNADGLEVTEARVIGFLNPDAFLEKVNLVK